MSLPQDFRFALRSLRARPVTTAFAILTLAIGLAAALALYAVVDAVLLRALPFPGADRLVELHEVAADGHAMALAWPNYADLAASIEAFEASAYHAEWPAMVASGRNATRTGVGMVGGDFFRVFGVAPRLGRAFDGGERDQVAVIGHRLWQGLLQGRVDVIGQPLDVDGQRYTIVGVMPPGFAFPDDTALWTPMLEDPGQSRSAHNWDAVARLQSPVQLGAARLAADALARRLAQHYGDDIDAASFSVTPLAEAIAAPVRKALLLLMAGTAFLLLIAVTNTTNLLLASNAARARERAVRAALGASAVRLARQSLVESLLIAGAAAALALVLAAAAIRLLVQLAGDSLPRAGEVHMGSMVAAAGVAAALAIALVTTAAVLWSQRRRAPVAELRESGRGQSPGRAQLRLRAALLVGQTALTTLLLVGAALLGRSFLALLAVDPGFEADGAMAISVTQPSPRDAAAAAGNARRYQSLMQAFAALPGVDAVGGVSSLPLASGGADGSFWDGAVTDLASPPKPIGTAEFRVASAGYLDAVGIPLLRGRGFDGRDRADGAQVAIISAEAARRTYGSADPIGRRIQYGNMDGDLHVLTIVGVAGDVHERLDRAPMGTVYVNLAQRPMAAAELDIVVRSPLPPASLAPALRNILEREASDMPYRLRPLADVRADALADRRFGLFLLGGFAAVALVLAVGGLYGLMAFAVGQREHEFALRQALGATRPRIAALVLRHGLAIGGLGVIAGLLGALVGARALGSLLYGIGARDAGTLAGVGLLLLATVLLACLLPARRACTVAPADVLA